MPLSPPLHPVDQAASSPPHLSFSCLLDLRLSMGCLYLTLMWMGHLPITWSEMTQCPSFKAVTTQAALPAWAHLPTVSFLSTLGISHGLFQILIQMLQSDSSSSSQVSVPAFLRSLCFNAYLQSISDRSDIAHFPRDQSPPAPEVLLAHPDNSAHVTWHWHSIAISRSPKLAS